MQLSKKQFLKTFGVSFLVIFLILTTVSLIGNSQSKATFTNSNVEFKDGVQVINIKAGLGYSPNRIEAQANVPSVLQIETQNTYDCTAFLNIPELNIKEFLPPTGVTTYNLLAMSKGEELEGFCGSDTYKFVIKFS